MRSTSLPGRHRWLVGFSVPDGNPKHDKQTGHYAALEPSGQRRPPVEREIIGSIPIGGVAGETRPSADDS